MKVIDSIKSYLQGKEDTPTSDSKKVHTKLPNGAIYTGRIVNGKMEGLGTLVYENGQRYEGQFLNGMKHGKGKYYYIRGQLYIGDWHENKKHGKGQYFYENGQRYCGQFHNNMKHGSGVMIQIDGSEYRGPYFENRKHGQGQYHDSRTGKIFIETYDAGKLIQRVERIEEEKFNTQDIPGTVKSLNAYDSLQQPGQEVEQQPAVYTMVPKNFDSGVSLSSRKYISGVEKRISTSFHSGNFLGSTKKIFQWNCEDVANWLEGLGLSEYTARFREEQVDGCSLMELSDSDMRDYLGVVLGDRKDLLRQIQMLRLIFKKQMLATYNQIKDIDFNTFTVNQLGLLNDSRLRQQQRKDQQLSPDQDTSSQSSEDEKKEAMKVKQQKKSTKRNIAKVVQEYLQKHGIKLNFLIPKQQLEILQPIGQGGYGQVYLAKWLGQEVAVKRYVKKEGLRNRHIGHFIQEVQLISRLLHPSIVLYMGMCIYDDQYAMITEFLSNGSLFDYLHKQHQKLTDQRTFYITKDIALGMTYLHGKRVLHCDLKSSNVLIDQNWNVKLCDFGLSRINNPKKGEAKRVGTPHWMAPEILRGEKYEFESDVYSFGMIIWEQLTGEIPYKNLSPAQIIGLVGKDQTHQIPIPKTNNQPMVELFLMCTKRKPKQRPSFAAIVEFLERHESKYESHLEQM